MIYGEDAISIITKEKYGFIDRPIKEFKDLQGRGIVAKIDDTEVTIGNRLLMKELNLNIPSDLNEQADNSEEKAQSVSYVSINKN